MCICIGIYIPKHSLLNLYNVACMYAFSPDHFYWITNWYTLPWGRLLENNNKLKCRVVESCPIDASSSTKGPRNIEEEKDERFQDSEEFAVRVHVSIMPEMTAVKIHHTQFHILSLHHPKRQAHGVQH